MSMAKIVMEFALVNTIGIEFFTMTFNNPMNKFTLITNAIWPEVYSMAMRFTINKRAFVMSLRHDWIYALTATFFDVDIIVVDSRIICSVMDNLLLNHDFGATILAESEFPRIIKLNVSSAMRTFECNYGH